MREGNQRERGEGFNRDCYKNVYMHVYTYVHMHNEHVQYTCTYACICCVSDRPPVSYHSSLNVWNES